MRDEKAIGVLYTVGAFGLWGFAALYWKALRAIPSIELLSHRIVWALPLLVLYVVVRRRVPALRAALADRHTRLVLLLTTALIAANWLTFIVAVNTDRVLQASLGYYINPLVNVLLGMLFLGERFSARQGLAVALAAVGVTILTIDYGHLPWIALLLAGTFGLYGLFRKTVNADAVTGLTVEVALCTPIALAFLVATTVEGANGFATSSVGTKLLIACAGPITIVPLVWFTNGARRIRLSTVGIIQYLAPTGQFLLAVLVFRETFRLVHLTAFVFIWTACTVYTLDARAQRRRAGSVPSR